MINGFIIDRRKTERQGKECTVYLLQHENGLDADGRVKYLNPKNKEVRVYTEEELVQYVTANNINLVNAMIKNGRIVARDASLNRFEQAGYASNMRPYTVCAEIRSDKDILLGYRVASARSGEVKAVSLGVLIEACETRIISALKASNNPKELYKPVQNMKFSPNIAHLHTEAQKVSVAMDNLLTSVCYTAGIDSQDIKASFLSIYSNNNPLPVEVWTVKSNQYVKPVAAATQQAAAAAAQKVTASAPDVSTIFTKEQLDALMEAKSKGVDIKKIANPDLSANRMRAIASLEADGFNGGQLNNPAWKDREFSYLAANIRLGVDVKEVLNPAYNTQQMTVILAGIMEGLDVNEYANPSLNFNLMSQKHRDMLDKAWCRDLGVIEGTKYAF